MDESVLKQIKEIKEQFRVNLTTLSIPEATQQVIQQLNDLRPPVGFGRDYEFPDLEKFKEIAAVYLRIHEESGFGRAFNQLLEITLKSPNGDAIWTEFNEKFFENKQ